MKRDEERRRQRGVSLPRTSTSDLMGRQSVRATFRLTEGCIDAISIVAAHLGIKQKSLFDHLVEDDHSLRSIAREIQQLKVTRQGRIQKTYVISRRSLSSLDHVSRNFDAPRDALVEYSVQRLLPIISREREKHEKRKEMLGEIAAHLMAGEQLINKIEKVLGKDDPIFQKMETVMNVYNNAYGTIDSFIEKGRIIEDFDIETMK
jgi:hypothetical protein